MNNTTSTEVLTPPTTASMSGLLGERCKFRIPIFGSDMAAEGWDYYDIQDRYCTFGCCQDDCCVPTAAKLAISLFVTVFMFTILIIVVAKYRQENKYMSTERKSLSASLLGKKAGEKSDVISGCQNPAYKSKLDGETCLLMENQH